MKLTIFHSSLMVCTETFNPFWHYISHLQLEKTFKLLEQLALLSFFFFKHAALQSIYLCNTETAEDFSFAQLLWLN